MVSKIEFEFKKKEFMGFYCYFWCMKISYLGFDELGIDLDWFDRVCLSVYVDFLDWKGVRIYLCFRFVVVVYLFSYEWFLLIFCFCDI